VLSLTVVRMLPVAVSLLGIGLRRDTVAFIGWFGPRGLASVVFTLLAFSTLHEHGLGASPILRVATYTILLSVVAHGLSATPLAAWYGRRADRAEADHAEYRDAPEPRVRRQSLTR
ncbi:MAG TPA: sodium:proton antiporter, partial [Actinomycetota bacterium]|nr:sodium:proton antiporter [Actinomycetota bacterium]